MAITKRLCQLFLLALIPNRGFTLDYFPVLRHFDGTDGDTGTVAAYIDGIMVSTHAHADYYYYLTLLFKNYLRLLFSMHSYFLISLRSLPL